MKVNKYSGNLTLLGNAQEHVTSDEGQNHSRNWVYSIIEIGDHVLKKIHVTKSLDNFLSRGLDQDGETTLHLVSNSRLLAVDLPDGSAYFDEVSIWKVIFMTVLTVIFGTMALVLPLMFGWFPGLVALLFGMQAYYHIGARKFCKEFEARGGVGV